MLSAYMEAVKPEGIRSVAEVPSGIHRWEAKVSALKNRYDEEIKESLKSAILVGMLPKEFQDMVLQFFSGSKQFKFEEVRDYVISVANNRAQWARPTPNLDAVDGEERGGR